MRGCAGRLMLAAALMLPLTACGATRETGMRVSGACVAFSPITFSASGDTRETVRQVRGHNAAWDAVCAAESGRNFAGFDPFFAYE